MQWEWTATKDANTCAACLALDGRTFPASVAFVPAHPNCRCRQITTTATTNAATPSAGSPPVAGAPGPGGIAGNASAPTTGVTGAGTSSAVGASARLDQATAALTTTAQAITQHAVGQGTAAPQAAQVAQNTPAIAATVAAVEHAIAGNPQPLVRAAAEVDKARGNGAPPPSAPALSPRQSAANQALRTSFDQGGVTAANFPSLHAQIARFMGEAPTLNAADFGLAPPPNTPAANGAAGGNGRKPPAAGGSGASGPSGASGDDAARTAGAAGAVADKTAQAASAAKDLSAGFGGSATAALRLGSALLGFPIGLFSAVAVARQLHEAIVSSVDAERNLEVSARAVAANYGQQFAGQARGAAQAFVADPTTKGTQPEQLAAVASLHQLTTEYGLQTDQIESVVTAGGRLAKLYGSDLPTTVGALKSVLEGNTSAAAAFGVQITDQAGRIIGLNATYSQLVQTYGQAGAEAKVLAAVLANVATQQDNNKGSSSGLADALDRLGRAAESAKQAAGAVLAEPATKIAIGTAQTLEGHPPINSAIGDAFDPTKQAAEAGRKAAGYQSIYGKEGQYLDQNGQTFSRDEVDKRVAAAAPRQDTSQAGREHREDAAGHVATVSPTELANAVANAVAGAERNANQQLLSQKNPQGVELPGTITSLQQQAAEHAAFAAAIQGNRPTLGLNTVDVALIAQQQAAQDELDRQKKDIAKRAADEVRANLAAQVKTAATPEARATAQRDLDRYDADQQIRARQIQADQQQQAAQRTAQIAGLNVQQLTAEQGARRAGEGIGLDAGVAQGLVGHGLSADQAQTFQQADTSVAQKSVELKAQEAALDLQILPLKQQQAQIEYQIGVSRRTNLDITQRELQATAAALPLRQAQAQAQYKIEDAHNRPLEAQLQGSVTQAQIGALAPSRAVEDITRGETRLALLASAGLAAAISGHPEDAPPGSLDLGGLQQQFYDLTVKGAGQELVAFDAQTTTIAADRAKHDEDMAAQARETPGRVEAATVAQAQKGPERAIVAAQNAQEQFLNSAHQAALDLERQDRAIQDSLQPLEQQAGALNAIDKALQDQFDIQETGSNNAIVAATAVALKTQAAADAASVYALKVQDIADAFQRGEQSLARTVDLLNNLPPGTTPVTSSATTTAAPGPQPPVPPSGTFLNPSTGSYEPLGTASSTTPPTDDAQSKSLLKDLRNLDAEGQLSAVDTSTSAARWDPTAQGYATAPRGLTADELDQWTIDHGQGGYEKAPRGLTADELDRWTIDHGQVGETVHGVMQPGAQPAALPLAAPAVAPSAAAGGSTSPLSIQTTVNIDLASAGSGGGISAQAKAEIIAQAVAEFTRELDQSIDSVQVPVGGLYSPGSR